MGQILAVSIVLSLGVWVRTILLFGVNVDLGWLGIPFTIFLMLGAINSLNLIDGMDGLLGSVGVILQRSGARGHGCPGGPLVGAATDRAVGFGRSAAWLSPLQLPAGQHFHGRLGQHACWFDLRHFGLSIVLSQGLPTTLAIAMPVVLMILPIFDTFAAIIRRALTGRSIYTTDRGHLHHCLLRQGFSISAALACSCPCVAFWLAVHGVGKPGIQQRMDCPPYGNVHHRRIGGYTAVRSRGSHAH